MGTVGPPLSASLWVSPSPVVQAAKELVWALRWLVPAWSSGTVWGWRKQASFGGQVEGSVMSCGVLGDVLVPLQWTVSVPLPSSGWGELGLNVFLQVHIV